VAEPAPEPPAADAHYLARLRIKEAFDLFDPESKGVIVKEEVSTVLRSLCIFPSEEQLVKDILPKLREKEEDMVQFRKLEHFALHQMFVARMYEPDGDETLLQAFRTLDSEQKGYLSESAMVAALTSSDYPFRDKEVDDFLRFAKDPDTGYIHYEDLVPKLSMR